MLSILLWTFFMYVDWSRRLREKWKIRKPVLGLDHRSTASEENAGTWMIDSVDLEDDPPPPYQRVQNDEGGDIGVREQVTCEQEQGRGINKIEGEENRDPTSFSRTLESEKIRSDANGAEEKGREI